jgi:fructan beta-fructosidase
MRTIKIDKHYLNLPVKNDAPMRHLTMSVDGEIVREFDIQLAEGKPDFWAFLDVSGYKGKSVQLKSSMVSLSGISQSDSIKDSGSLYNEKLRPQFHFSTKRGWLNDPNGLVYYAGEYHLYYQYDPYSWGGNLKHWGHTVSTDLVHWKELPVAIYPHHYGDAVWSGSAAVDWKNTGGFKTGKDDVIVAAYTSIDRGECIVFSNDRGRTFTEFSGNPVIKHAGRDPRLFWHSPSNSWVIAVYDELPDKPQGIAFYTSPDLRKWTRQSRIDGFFECPDIFQMPVDGDKTRTKWVLTAANSEYMLGQFDGKTFNPETPKLPGHRGNAFYAAQTFSDMSDGRRVQIGWATIATPGMPFNQMMAFPCEMTLRTTPEGVRMFWEPVREIESLRASSFSRSNMEVQPGSSYKPAVRGDLLDISIKLSAGQASTVTIIVHGMPVIYNAADQTLNCGGKVSRIQLDDGLRILADRTSLEIFGNKGALYIPMTAHYLDKTPPMEVSVIGGSATVQRLDVHTLRSAWR